MKAFLVFHFSMIVLLSGFSGIQWTKRSACRVWLSHVCAFILIGLTISAVGVNALKTSLQFNLGRCFCLIYLIKWRDMKWGVQRRNNDCGYHFPDENAS